ncbi:hypothetical protein [Streptomyces sp. NRRL F-5650]|uniref:hypothetical protein n=1 Tax=Streptomyces sp. NRRL F-5650 TaxID=1463868 RepID=UPI0004CBE727|nr:hypothetical protein [Streptomyces sp. NRRL F-5650]
MAGSVQILGTGQLLTLSRKMRAAGGPRLRQNFSRRIRRAAEPLHKDLQKAIRNQPLVSEGRKAGKRGGPSPTTRPFRQMLAGGIRISVRSGAAPGARVWIDKSQLEPKAGNVPWQIQDGRLRHPVFGNRKRWSSQYARPSGWWSKTVAAGTPRMQAEVQRILGDVRRDLT